MVSSGAPRRPVSRSRSAWSSFQKTSLIAIVSFAGFLWLGRDLPRVPWPTPDTQSYLQFSSTRPHGYSWFLTGYHSIFEDLAYLPHAQLTLFVTAVFLLGCAVARRTSTLVLPVATLILIFAGLDASDFLYLMSDLVYAATLTAGIAFFMIYVADRRPIFLALASMFVGLAVTFRAIGLALLLGLCLAVVAECIGRRRKLIPTILLSAVPAAIILCGAILSQYTINGRLGLGSWSGMHVLGKLPLLSKPVSDDSRLSFLNGILQDMAPARMKLVQLNPLIEALVARQYYEYLRWHVILPELERSWVDWRNGDDFERGRLAGELAKAYVAEDPLGFLRRTGIELLGLWTMPRWLSSGERSAALADLESVGELPLLTEFSRTPQGEYEFYKIVPEPVSLVKLAVFRFAIIAFWALTLGLIVAFVLATRNTARLMPDVVLIVVAVHAIYAGTALMEGVHERYVMPTWPVLVCGPMLALGLMRRSVRGDRQLPARP